MGQQLGGVVLSALFEFAAPAQQGPNHADGEQQIAHLQARQPPARTAEQHRARQADSPAQQQGLA